MNWKQLKQKKIVLKKSEYFILNNFNTNKMVGFSVDGAQVSFGQLLRRFQRKIKLQTKILMITKKIVMWML